MFPKFLAGSLSNLSDRAINVVARLGGLVIVTIGVHLALTASRASWDLPKLQTSGTGNGDTYLSIHLIAGTSPTTSRS